MVGRDGNVREDIGVVVMGFRAELRDAVTDGEEWRRWCSHGRVQETRGPRRLPMVEGII